MLNEDFKKELVSELQIKDAVKKLALELNEKYKGKPIVAVGLLKGVFIFISDIVRELDLDVQIEFLVVKSYSGETTSGKPEVVLDIKESIKGKEIIIFEDIIDTGRTLKEVKKHLEDRGANSVEIATLLSKPARREVEVDAKWVLFEIPDEFVVGYGLDYNEKYRHLKSVMALSQLGIDKYR